MDWVVSVNETNFDQFPLLDVEGDDDEDGDEESGEEVVTRFENMRLAETFTEWVSQLYFIILTSYASISHNSLYADVGSLVFRCKESVENLRKGSMRLEKVIADTFQGSPGPEAMFFGTNLFWKGVNEKKSNNTKYSQFRISLLLAKRVLFNYHALQNKPHLKRMELSVKDMFASHDEFSSPGGKPNRPQLAHYYATIFRVEEDVERK